MMEDKTIAVLTPMTLYNHKSGKIVAARLEELGLTAYGHTREEAITACENLFDKFTLAYKNRGSLIDRLNEVGVAWHWVDAE